MNPPLPRPRPSPSSRHRPLRRPSAIALPSLALVVFAVSWMLLGWSLAPGPAAARDTQRCDFCREAISGRYAVYTVGSAKTTLCTSCDARSPRCAACRAPYREAPTVVGGQSLCRSCARVAKACHVCDGLLLGAYSVYTLEFGRISVCSSCVDTAPRCAGCRRPVNRTETTLSGGQRFCGDCADKLTHCQACEGPIIGSRYSIRFLPGEYCERCWKTRPACSMCGAPTGRTHARLDDGRDLCGRCASTAVVTHAEIEKIYARARAILEPELGKPLTRDVTLRLVGPDELDEPLPETSPRRRWFQGRASVEPTPAAAATAPNPHPASAAPTANARPAAAGATTGLAPRDPPERGPGQKEMGRFLRRGDHFEIRILSGQPREWAWETVAHEFAHAWQSKYNPDLNDSVWEEGFAQWAAEIVLHEMGMEETLERLRLRDDFYGQAFRIVNRYEALRGKAGVLNAVLHIKNEKQP